MITEGRGFRAYRTYFNRATNRNIGAKLYSVQALQVRAIGTTPQVRRWDFPKSNPGTVPVGGINAGSGISELLCSSALVDLAQIVKTTQCDITALSIILGNAYLSSVLDPAPRESGVIVTRLNSLIARGRLATPVPSARSQPTFYSCLRGYSAIRENGIF